MVICENEPAPDRQASVVIDAPADRVWALVTDITRTGEWSPENVGGTEWLSSSRIGSIDGKKDRAFANAS